MIIWYCLSFFFPLRIKTLSYNFIKGLHLYEVNSSKLKHHKINHFHMLKQDLGYPVC